MILNNIVVIINDRDNFGDLWVFGKDVNGNEVYIKIVLMGISTNMSTVINRNMV